MYHFGYCSQCGKCHNLESTAGCISDWPPRQQIPHCCPVCHGTGRVLSHGPGAMGTKVTDIKCPACGGTCVVWG